MDKKDLQKFAEVSPLPVRQYEQYMPPEDNANYVEKLNQVIQSLARIGRLNNDTVKMWNSVMEWITTETLENIVANVTNEKLDVSLNNGLKELTVAIADGKINELLQSGQFESIVETAITTIHSEVTDELAEFNVKLAETEENVNRRVDTLVIESGDANAEVTDAHVSTAKGKTFSTIRNRFEETESEVGNISTDLTNQSPLINLVPNSNFVDTNGWSANTTANLSVNNNILSMTTNNVSQYPVAVTPKIIDSGHNKKLFFKARIRVTNADCANIRGELRYTSGRTEIPTVQKTGTWFIRDPIMNQWYDVYFTATLDSANAGFDSGCMLFFQQAYNAITTGKSMEIEKIMVVDITDFPLVGKESSEIEMKNLIEKLPNGYFHDKANIGDLIKIIREDLITGGSGDVIDSGVITQINTELTTNSTKITRLENDFSNVIGNEIDAVLNNQVVATDIANKLNAKEVEYAPRLTAMESKTYAPRLAFSQVANRGGVRNVASATSDYIIFESFYHVYDVPFKTTGAIYAVEQHRSGKNKQGVYRSLDGGEKWDKLWDLDVDVANGVWYDYIFVEPFQETFYLIKRNNGNNTPANNDVVSFSNTFVQIGSKNIGDARWLSGSHTIDAMPSSNFSQRIVIFGEYAGDTKDVVHLWRTTDKGATWTSVLSYTGNNGTMYSGEIRHFHCVQVDPYTSHWWAASGDGNPQCKIWRSTDEGLTWNLLFEGSQRERLCVFVFEKDYAYYGMDSSQTTLDHSKIVRINKATLERVDVATVFNGNAVYNLTRTYAPEGFLVWSTFEGGANTWSDKSVVQFYDYLTGKIYDVATVSITGYPQNHHHGFVSASRYQDLLTGNIIVTPTNHMQQLKYGIDSVSKFAKVKFIT